MSKTESFIDFISDNITETWLSANDQAARASITSCGYKLTDCPRVKRTGGGTALLFAQSIDTKLIDSGETSSFEFSEYVESSDISDINKLRFCVVYRPPYSASDPITVQRFLSEFPRYLETVILLPEPLVICGGFNSRIDVFDDHDTAAFMDLLESMALEQHVSFATHEYGHTLQLIITRSSDSLLLGKPSSGPFISDHCIVSCFLDVCKLVPKKKLVSFRRTKAIDITAFRSELCASALVTDTPACLDDLVSLYISMLETALDKCAPMLTKVITTPWFNDEIKFAERKWRKSRSHSDLLDYKSKKNHLSFVMKH